jgi:hypothetical protein
MRGDKERFINSYLKNGICEVRLAGIRGLLGNELKMLVFFAKT